MEQTIEELAPYMRGWRGYFGFCETPTVLIASGRVDPEAAARRLLATVENRSQASSCGTG